MDDNYRNIDQSLLAAYVRTTYRVDALDLQIRIGLANANLQQLLTTYGAHTWAFITAWNPKSVLLSQHENEARHEMLVKIIEKMSYPYFVGHGIGDDENWPPEQSLLILGISKQEALALGRQFEQNAIVFGTQNTLPTLVFC